MFSLLRRPTDPFNQRHKKQEVWKFLRRIIDKNSAEKLLVKEDVRSGNRIPFCLPVMLQPCLNEQPLQCEPIFALTRDLSDDGVAVVASQPLDLSQIICVIRQDRPIFLLGDIRQCIYLGGGFWKVGMQLTEILSSQEYLALGSLSKQLNPEAEWDLNCVS